MDGGLMFFEPEVRVGPLFYDRRPHQCCWPMWGDSRNIDTKRVCGAGVQVGSKVPYCPDHLERQRGPGSKSERSAPRVLLKLTEGGKA
ncbi:hypothetical protein ASG43_03175 [Aureimonas sp. Leaf454]|uniref:hypothetical protein n=1 Tax=Aureimonas sp. Leaf454 TaxID=1736381 RepID=UPI0006FD8AC6|nr:hypothetical protein [Aureimonas sp. Leaf454]KQT54601.1 hypothetical protein ASG43_03175 [Aureimonas sp. Leaf454]